MDFKKVITTSLFLLFIGGFLQGCYSFKGTSIPPGVNTFSVLQVKNSVPEAPPTLGQDFGDKMIDKIRSQSRLKYDDMDPDISFDCRITEYSVSSIDPKPDETTAYNQLRIAIQVNYIDEQDDANNWTQTFSFFEQFESSQNLMNVQSELHEVILEDIATKVFDKAFTNW